MRSDAAAALDEALSRKGRRSLEEELQLPDGPEGEEHHLYVQAITWKGVVQETDSLSCGAAICIDAPWGFDVHALLMPLWDAARRSRLRRLICHDPLDASCVAHIAVGGTVFSSAVWPEARVLTPPLDRSVLARESRRLAFDRALYDLALNQAIDALAAAKQLHNQLKRYYIDAMDYEKLDEIKESFLKKLP